MRDKTAPPSAVGGLEGIERRVGRLGEENEIEKAKESKRESRLH
jgi:hypothetical protein